jgi:hypothetical protein
MKRRSQEGVLQSHPFFSGLEIVLPDRHLFSLSMCSTDYFHLDAPFS